MIEVYFKENTNFLLTQKQILDFKNLLKFKNDEDIYRFLKQVQNQCKKIFDYREIEDSIIHTIDIKNISMKIIYKK